MEILLKRLQEIGIRPETIEAIRANKDKQWAREYALLLVAMYDDRFEFVD